MSLKALGNNVIIKIDSKEKQSDGGLILAIEQPDEQLFGEVVSVGSVVDCVKVGDRVMIPTFQGNDFKRDEVQYKTLGSKYILAIVE